MNAQRSTGWLAVVALGLLCGGTARAEVLRDEALGFTLTVPDGFVDYPPGREQQGTPYAYVKGEPGTTDFTIIGIKPMGGTIGQAELLPLLRSLLASLDGPSNWLTDKERSLSAGKAVGGLVVMLGLTGWAIARWRKRRAAAITASGRKR